MAQRVFGDAAIPEPERHARFLAKHLKANGILEFNARTLRHEIGGPLREAKDMDEACGALVEAGLIRERFSRAGPAKDRPAKNYEVNQAILGSEQ